MASRAKTPAPTDAELDLLRVLWKRGPSTVREVFDSVVRSKGTGYTTVLKQMQVMRKKGLVRRSERFRAHVYEPAEAKTDTQRRLARGLLERAFGGSAKGLLQSALAGRTLDEQELAEIRTLLAEIEGGGR